MNFETLPGGKRVSLLSELAVPTPLGILIVPKGFITDGASIPRWAWPLVGPPLAGPHFKAAVVHDYLCDRAKENNDYGERVLADAVFYMVLYQTEGVPIWKRSIMYGAVRMWGRMTYKRVKPTNRNQKRRR